MLTPEQIKQLAFEAYMTDPQPAVTLLTDKMLQKFADLVAERVAAGGDVRVKQPAAEFAWPGPEPATVADVLAGIVEVERLMDRPNLSPVEQLLRDQPDLSLVEVCRRMMVIPQIGSSASSEAPARGTEGYLHNVAEGPVLDRDALFEAIKGIPPMPTVEQLAERYGLKLGPRLCPLPFPDGPPMTTEQVAAMARAGYTIVSHSAPPTDEQTLVAQPAAAVSDEEILTEAARHLGEMHVENCGLDDIKAFARAILALRPQSSGFQNALDIRSSQGWKLTGQAVPVLYTDEINGRQVMRDDVWLCTTEALRPQAVPMTDEQTEVLRFLLGESSLEDCHFGDMHPDKRGRFWWRNNLREAFGITQRADGGEG